MKNQLLILLLFLSGNLLFAQDKEWKSIVDLLQKETEYFKGRSGFIRLMKSTYNMFMIEYFSVSETQFASAMRLCDRFDNESTEQYLKETVVIMYAPKIKSAKVFYDHTFYFEEFPNEQFLLIEFEEEWIHQSFPYIKPLKTERKTNLFWKKRPIKSLCPYAVKTEIKFSKP